MQINCGRAKLEDCGVCGDPLSQTPGANVNGGKYGTGTIVRTYKEGDLIHTKTEVTANDMGWFEFAICSLDDKPHANESCFVPLKVVDVARHPNGFPKPEYKWKLFKADGAGVFDIKLELPLNFTCDHCTLRSLWNCGNNHGCEVNGKCGIGFGPNQVKFYACADISITSHGNPPNSTTTPRRTVNVIGQGLSGHVNAHNPAIATNAGTGAAAGSQAALEDRMNFLTARIDTMANIFGDIMTFMRALDAKMGRNKQKMEQTKTERPKDGTNQRWN